MHSISKDCAYYLTTFLYHLNNNSIFGRFLKTGHFWKHTSADNSTFNGMIHSADVPNSHPCMLNELRKYFESLTLNCMTDLFLIFIDTNGPNFGHVIREKTRNIQDDSLHKHYQKLKILWNFKGEMQATILFRVFIEWITSKSPLFTS